jgi:hypothetical protein
LWFTQLIVKQKFITFIHRLDQDDLHAVHYYFLRPDMKWKAVGGVDETRVRSSHWRFFNVLVKDDVGAVARKISPRLKSRVLTCSQCKIEMVVCNKITAEKLGKSRVQMH